MDEKKNNSDKLYNEIMAQKPTEVKLALSKIDEMLDKNVATENYEDCAKLRDAKISLNGFLDGTKTYDDIKDELSFAKQKISDLISDSLKNKNNRRKK